MRYHSGDGSFAMRSGYTDIKRTSCYGAQHFTAFQQRIVVLLIIHQLAMLLWYSGGVYDQLRIFWHQVQPVFIMYRNTFTYQLLCQRCFRLIVATYFFSMKFEITGQRTHSNTPDAYEINLLYIAYVNH